MVETYPVPPAPGPNQALQEDTLCASCGYNLRGLLPSGACPECGIAVGRSVFGNRLEYSDPDWVDKLRRGASLLRWTIVISILLAMFRAILGRVLVAWGGIGMVPMALFVLAGLAARTLGVGAAFLVTAQEPRVALIEDPITLRKVVRYCALAAFAGELLNHMSGLCAADRAAVLKAAGATLTVVGIVGFVGQFVYFRRFALRLPDEKLAKSTRTVMWGFVAGFAACGVSAIVKAAAGSVAAGVGALGGSTACVMMVALLAFACWAYRLLLKYNEAFRTAADQARRFAQQHPSANRALDD